MKLNGKRHLVFLVFVLSLLLATTASGCWDMRDLDEQVHVLTAYLDLEPDGTIRLTAEVLGHIPAKAGAGGGGATHSVLSASGASLQDAAWNIRWQTVAELNFAHMGAVVIGEELARAGITDLLDWLVQDYEIRRKLFVSVMAGRASDLLTAGLTTTRHSEQIIALLRAASEAGTNGGRSDLNEIMRTIASEGKDVLLARFVLLPPPPVEHIAEHAQGMGGGGAGGEGGGEGDGGDMGGEGGGPEFMALRGAAVLRDGTLVGFVEEPQADGLQFLLMAGRNRGLRIVTGSARQGFTLHTSSASPRITVSHQEGRLVFDVKLAVTASIRELDAGAGDMSSPGDIARLEELAAQQIETHVLDGLRHCIDELGTDPIGFGRLMSRWRPALWEQHRDEWPQGLKEAEINIRVDVQIPNTTMLRAKARGPATAPRPGGL